MIYLRIINTKNLINADIQALVEALPFGDDEKKRLLSIKRGQGQLESLGALIALRDIMSSNVSKQEISCAKIIRDESQNGKPRFEDETLKAFSLAHSCGFSAAVLGKAKIGVDIELIRPHAHKQELANRFFGDDERARFSSDATDENFLLLWTQKEALVKLHGASLASSLGGDLPDGKLVFSNVIDIDGERIAVTVYSELDDEIELSIAN